MEVRLTVPLHRSSRMGNIMDEDGLSHIKSHREFLQSDMFDGVSCGAQRRRIRPFDQTDETENADDLGPTAELRFE